MQIQLPIFILALLVHAGIYLTSNREDRRIRMLAGVVVLFATLPLWYGGIVLQGAQETATVWLSRLLIWSPYFLPLLSFLVYFRGRRKPISH